jgi:purine-binding chemotaxis protein CheW
VSEPHDLLAERARRLARPAPRQDHLERRLMLLDFPLGGERYAVEAHRVREVVPTVNMTPLPAAPPFVLGIVPVRGLIWSVMDLRLYFGIPRRGLSDQPRAILVEAGSLRWGILAEGDLRLVPLGNLRPPPDVTEKIPRSFIRGVTDDLAVVLDLEALAHDPRMIVQEDVE